MCIIIYKPKGVKLPSMALLNRARFFNPHGFGFCSPKHSYKGLNFETFIKNLDKCKVDEPILMHFRYATQGSIKKSNCHPFYDKNTNTYFMHNGVLPYYPENDITDSEFAFNLLLNHIDSGISSRYFKAKVNEIIGSSRFAFMQDENVYLFGSWVSKDGLYFSNNRIL